MKIRFSMLLLSSFVLASCSSTMNTDKKWAHSAPKKSEYRSIASDKKASIEQWKGKDGLKFVYRNDNGLFKTWATLEFESWSNDEESQWVARLENGQFVTGFRGTTEKFDVGGKREELRIVIRNASGEFVTWKAIDDLVEAKFDAWDIDGDGNEETVYVVRYNGKFLNWSKANLEQWRGFEHPVLVVRDTADGKNNGELLSWIAPEVYKSGPNKGNVFYKDPETGRFVSPNN